MDKTRPPISYIVPAFNCAKVLPDAVQSIYSGNFAAGDEIVLVDDCSTDETPQIIRKMQAEHESLHPMRHPENRGTAAAARNTGISSARNELIFSLDADNILVAGSVHGLVEHMLGAGADVASFGELHYFQNVPDEVSHKWMYRESVSLADALSGFIWPGPSGNYLFTRESWLRAGRYPEPSLENRSLDSWSFAIRQLGTGSRMVTLPRTWYYHRFGHESHYVRNWRKGSQSLVALAALLPLLNLIEDEDVEYLFSRGGRYTWFEKLADRPIRIKGLRGGKDGVIQGVEAVRGRSGALLLTRITRAWASMRRAVVRPESWGSKRRR